MPFVVGILALLLAAAGALAAFPTGRRLLASIIGHVMIWTVWMLQHAAPAVAEEVMGVLVQALEATRPSVLGAAGVLLRELTGQEVNLDVLSKQTLSEFVGATTPDTGSSLVRGIISAVAPDVELTPEQGLTNLSALFTLHMSTALQAWMIDLIGEALSLGRLRSFAQFHAAVDAALGFRRVGMLMWRGPIQKAITEPIIQLYNRRYRITLPSPQQAVTGWQRGVYSDDRYLDIMRSHGYRYEVAQDLLTVHEKEIAVGDLALLYQRGQVDADTIARVLKHQGYAQEQADLITAWLEGKTTQTLTAEMATLARTLFKAGDLGEDEYRSFLEQAHYRPDEIALALAVDQLALRNEKQLTVQQILLAFQHEVYDAQRARELLRKQRYTDDTIDALFATQRRQLSSAQVVDLFNRGQITGGEATTRLERLGYSTEDAGGLIALRTRTLTEGQILDALGRGLMNVGDATDALLRLGFSREAVDILLAFQRKVLAPADVQAAIARQLLTPAEGLARLIGLGYSQEDAQLLVDLRFRLLTVGQTLDAYGDGLLTRVDALADLRAKGLSPDDALLVVRVFDLKAQAATAKKTAPPAPRRPPPVPGAPPAGP